MWAFHLAIPLAGLWLILARPSLDVEWTHHAWHFALVVGAAAASAAVALRVRAEARRHDDARLTLISLAFLAAAGFLLLHGLTTPQVLHEGPNTSFVVTTPIGLVLAAGLVLWSSFDHGERSAAVVLRAEPAMLAALAIVVAGWAVASLAGVDPLARPFDEARAFGLQVVVGLGLIAYLVTTVRYWVRYRRRPAVMLISLITAFVLLAQSLVAVALSRSWHLSWWLWHVLMLIAFAFVWYSARVEYRREGSTRGLFSGIAGDETIRRLHEEHRAAVEELLDAMRQDRDRDEERDRCTAARVGAEFGLTSNQVAILVDAAQATLEVDDLRRQLDTLFHQYISPDVAETLLAEPERADLGGDIVEVTCLFADLRGFTSFSERSSPEEVVGMLNRYFQATVPIILHHGGTVVQFMGDAVMALFNAPKPVADHEVAAARTALAMQEAVAGVATDGHGWPRFRIGVNTGPALIGNIGGSVRSFTAIGDAINVAARLEGVAEPGQVVVGSRTAERLSGSADLAELGAIEVKGRVEPVEAYVLTGLLVAR